MTEAQVAESLRITGTSFESFSDAAAKAFDQVPTGPDNERMATALVYRHWLTKGGVVGRTQFHVEIVADKPERP